MMDLSERIKKLNPYVPGEQPQDRQYLKLNTNENPYPPSPQLKELLGNLDADQLRLYPDPLAIKLREKIGERYGLTKEQVFVSNGSDEALFLLLLRFLRQPEGKLLFPEVTYSFYPVYCDYYGIEYETIPLGGRPDDLCRGIRAKERVLRGCLCQPERADRHLFALKGHPLSLGELPAGTACAHRRGVYRLRRESAVSLLRDCQNLLLVRTFSKSMSLAGVRLGFVLAGKELIDALATVKDSFNSYPVSSLTQRIGEIALSDESYYRSINNKIISVRESFSSALGKLGWIVLPSKANFVFARKEGAPGKEIYLKLKERGILSATSTE